MRFTLYKILLYVCFAQTHCGMFNFNTDNFLKRYLSGVFTARPHLRGNTVTPIDIPAHVRRTTKAERTTTPPYKYSINRIADYNLTLQEFEIRRLRTDVDMILTKNNTVIDFEVDDIVLQTRRFDKIRVKPVEKPTDYLREVYFSTTDAKRFLYQKNKTLLLMEQFIYETRYKLPYVQLLQKKYMDTFRYKIGYLFAVLQHLKLEQHVLYTTMKRYLRNFQNIFIHIKMYEKIIRLDVDIKDVISYIKKINWDRMQFEDIVYFEQVKHLQQ